MSTLNIHQNTVIFDDSNVATNQPKLQYVSWTTDYSGIQVSEPSSKQYFLQPAESLTVFSGTRTVTIDDTTTFDLTLNPVLSGVYRLTGVSGTAPGFRTSRAVTLSGETVTVTVNNNATAEFALTPTSTPTFAAVQVGDTLFIPDTTTGDSASPFSVLNVGFWTVLAVTNSGLGANRKLVCKRPNSQQFQGVAESVAVTANSQFKVFSASGVQAGDTLEILAGFSSVSQNSYVLQTVTDTWVEFSSAEPLPLESGVAPGSAGISIYSESVNFLRVEVDQPAVVRLNADITNNLKLPPRAVGSQQDVAYFEAWSSVYKLVLINKSTETMKATVITAVSGS